MKTAIITGSARGLGFEMAYDQEYGRKEARRLY